MRTEEDVLRVLRFIQRPHHRNDRRVLALGEAAYGLLARARDEHFEVDYLQIEILLREFERLAAERLYDGRLRRYSRACKTLEQAIHTLTDRKELTVIEETVVEEVNAAPR